MLEKCQSGRRPRDSLRIFHIMCVVQVLNCHYLSPISGFGTHVISSWKNSNKSI